MLKERDKAPEFSLQGSDGKTHTLTEFSGKYLVLYFYPKDDTPGCTTEAKCFNGSMGAIKAAGAEVVGVSSDNLESHGKFSSKYGLSFLLLSDPHHEVIKKYDAYGDRGVFGKGTLRKTFVIDGNGIIVRIFDKVKPDGHDKQVLEFINSQKG
ncbi:MAG: peroxiredoxin [Candidatus Marsarchaeota archaeon]|jgi:peroxiredoxin Q/BCP|nr:peroxiredoxin [Candidatus Marsarchaeota archaeon]